MAYRIKSLTSVGILLFSMVVLSKKTNTPEIIVAGNFSENINNTPNRTYLTSEQRLFQISCVSNTPNRWRWMVLYDNPKMISVIKERKQSLDVNGSKIKFFSNLTIDLKYNDGPPENNFTCSVETNLTRKEWIHQNIICVELNTDGNGTYWSIYHDAIPLLQCLPRIQNFSSECNDDDIDLNVDSKNLRAECRKKDNIEIHTLPCGDLDTCDSNFETYSQSKDTSLCKGNVKDMYKPFVESNKINITNQRNPLLIYCKKTNDFYDYAWTAYTVLYSIAGETYRDNGSYLTTQMDARNHKNSLKLYPVPPGSSYEGLSGINTSYVRNDFGEGENATFICVAIKYLFMYGFQWKINGTYLPETGVSHEDKSMDGYFVMLLSIPMNSTHYGKHPTISCAGPIWNSDKFVESEIYTTISPAVPPSVNLTCSKAGDTLNCSCLYGGWPEPNITWSDSLNISALKSGKSDSISPTTIGNWSARKVFQNIPLSYPNTFNITCLAVNFRGNCSTSTTIQGAKYTGFSLTSILVTVFCSICILVLLVGFMYWMYRRKLMLYNERQYNLTPEEINEFYGGASNLSTTTEALTIPYDSEYEIPKDELIFDGTILGTGQFGLVLKGKIGALTVAVKTVKPTADLIYLKSLLRELKVLQFIGSHSSIVNLIGAQTGNINKREVFLILDYCSNGSLVSLLRNSRETFIDFFNDSNNEGKDYPIYQNSQDVILTTNNLIIFSTEIASALAHLESKNVIHGDIAARNVLVTEDLHAKLCDFGLSKQLLHYTVYVQKIDCPLPLRWMAVESLQDMEFSLASDKWSYGIVLWEIFSLGQLPYPGEQWSFASYQSLKDGYRMSKPQYASNSLHKLMLECWDVQPQNRPSFQHVISQLKKEEEMLT